MSTSTMASGRMAILPCGDFVSVCPGEGRVMARYLAGLPRLLRRSGKDSDEILSRHGFDPLSFADPEHPIECARVLPLLDHCGRLADPFLGLTLADQQGPGAYGYLAPLCQSAPDVRTALEAFITYVPLLVSPEGIFELRESSKSLEIRWDCDSDSRMNQQGNLHGASILIKLLKSIIGSDFVPDQLQLPACVGRQCLPELSRRLGCEVSLNTRNYGGFVFSTSYLSRPVPGANRFTYSALHSPIGALKCQVENDISSRVVRFIRTNFHLADCNIEECAASLGISVRALQKHLARMGESFSKVLEDEKCKLAQAALARSAVSLDEVAFQLGYAEQSTFGRAFRRWTGMSPGEFRKSASR